MAIKFIRMIGNEQPIPKPGTPNAAGLDLRANERIEIGAKKYALIGTGFKVELPNGNVGQIWARSGLASKQGVQIMAGVIDPDYRGEIKVLLYNAGIKPLTIEVGDRIAQMLVMPLYPNLTPVEVKETTETKRGEAGFGSTGKS